MGEVNEMMDFSDLANGLKFKFKGDIFEIPPISGTKAKKLFAMSKKLKVNKRIVDPKVENKEQEEEMENDVDSVFDFQAEYINAAVIGADGIAVAIEVVQEWPSKLTNQVMKLINEQINPNEKKVGQEKNS